MFPTRGNPFGPGGNGSRFAPRLRMNSLRKYKAIATSDAANTNRIAMVGEMKGEDTEQAERGV